MEIDMTALLIGLVVVLTTLVGGLIWAWIIAVPKTNRYKSYEAMTAQTAKRNRAWDAAVSRARNRAHG
jgi:hypothetical protein